MRVYGGLTQQWFQPLVAVRGSAADLNLSGNRKLVKLWNMNDFFFVLFVFVLFLLFFLLIWRIDDAESEQLCLWTQPEPLPGRGRPRPFDLPDPEVTSRPDATNTDVSPAVLAAGTLCHSWTVLFFDIWRLSLLSETLSLYLITGCFTWQTKESPQSFCASSKKKKKRCKRTRNSIICYLQNVFGVLHENWCSSIIKLFISLSEGCFFFFFL